MTRRRPVRRSVRIAVRAAAGLLLAAPLVAAAVGCHDNDAPIAGRGDRFEQPWLTLGSQNLRRDTVVQDARPVRDANGILTVAVPVRNVTDQVLHVGYVYRFYDDKGMLVNSVPGVLHIPARQSATAVANASGPQARDFKLELNYPRVN